MQSYHTRLGEHGPTVSRLALGTWTFAGGAMWGETDTRNCEDTVRAALDAGVTFFDSAPTYGEGLSEEILGTALKGRSDDVVVATKCRVDNLDESGLGELIDGSRKRLRRDRIDLMQIHWPPGDPEQSRRALGWLAEHQSRGRVGWVGVCNFGVYDLEETKDLDLVSNQLPYNIMWRVIEKEIVEATDRRGMGIIGYSTLLHGLLGGRYRDLDRFPDGRARTRHFGPSRPGIRHQEEGMEEESQRLLDELHRLASEAGVSVLDLSIQFALSRPFIDAILVGARNPRQFEDTLEAVRKSVSPDMLMELTQLSEGLRMAAGGNPDLYQTDSRIRYTPE